MYRAHWREYSVFLTSTTSRFKAFQQYLAQSFCRICQIGAKMYKEMQIYKTILGKDTVVSYPNLTNSPGTAGTGALQQWSKDRRLNGETRIEDPRWQHLLPHGETGILTKHSIKKGLFPTNRSRATRGLIWRKRSAPQPPPPPHHTEKMNWGAGGIAQPLKVLATQA